MPYGPNCTLDLFEARLADAGFEDPGLYQLTKRNEIETALMTCLRSPLVFDNETLPVDALWWFRGGASLPLRAFQALGDSRYLLQSQGTREELSISTVWVNRSSDGPDASFIYLRCKPDQPKFMTREAIQQQRDTFKFAYEDLRYFVHLDQYEEINDVEEGESGWEYRTRFVTPYNLFIAPKESKLNNTGGTPGHFLELMCNGLLEGVVTLQQVTSFVAKMPTTGFHEFLVSRSTGT